MGLRTSLSRSQGVSPDGEASLPPAIHLNKKVLTRFPGKDFIVLGIMERLHCLSC